MSAESGGNPSAWNILAPCGGFIAETGSGTDAANARLIAAAPELLAACRMALDSIPESVACFNAANEAEATRPTVLESYLRAAIAKATGGGL